MRISKGQNRHCRHGGTQATGTILPLGKGRSRQHSAAQPKRAISGKPQRRDAKQQRRMTRGEIGNQK